MNEFLKEYKKAIFSILSIYSNNLTKTVKFVFVVREENIREKAITAEISLNTDSFNTLMKVLKESGKPRATHFLKVTSTFTDIIDCKRFIDALEIFNSNKGLITEVEPTEEENYFLGAYISG